MVKRLNLKTALLAQLLSIYNNYVSLGYPEDTSFYVLKSSPETMSDICVYFSSGAFFPPVIADRITGTLDFSGGGQKFKLKEVGSMLPGEIDFGPVSEVFIWKGI